MIFTSCFKNINCIDLEVRTINSHRNHIILNDEIARIKVISLMTAKIKLFLSPILLKASKFIS